MSIQKLGLKNFRIFKEQTDFDLAPITVFTGPNNSGKSTAIKALVLLAESAKSSNFQYLLKQETFTGFNITSAISNTNSSNSDIEFILKLQLDCEQSKLGYLISESTTNNAYFIEGLVNKQIQLCLKYSKKQKRLFTLNELKFSINSELIYEYSNKADKISDFKSFLNVKFLLGLIYNKSRYFAVDRSFKNYSSILFKIQQNATSSYDEIEPYIKKYKSIMAKIDQAYINLLEKMVHNIEEEGLNYKWSKQLPSPIDIEINYNSFKQDNEPSFWNLYYKPLVDKQIYESKFKLSQNEKKFLYELYYHIYYDLIKRIEQFPDYFFELIKNEIIAGTNYFPTFRPEPIREFSRNMTNTLAKNLFSRETKSWNLFNLNDNRAMSNNFNQDTSFEFTNKVLKDLYQIGEKIQFIPNDYNGNFELKLITKENKEGLNIVDLGSGVYQLISLLVSIDAKKGQKNSKGGKRRSSSTFLIEEPEISLHPNFQSKLADVFALATKEYGVNFIIETHSEYLIRKLQYLTALKDSEYKLNTKDSVIYYLSGESTRKINILKDGSLSEDFGKGFFDEAIGLKLELLSLKNQN